MLPNITNSFIPFGGYIAFSLFSLLIVIFYSSRIQKDIAFSKINTIQVFTIPLYISFIISILCLLTFFLPFIEIPFIGGVNLLEITSRMDDDMIYLTPFILLHILLIVFTGITAFTKISFKGAKSENFDLILAFLVFIIDLFVWWELAERLNPSTTSDNFLVDKLIENLNFGIGMYLLLFLSLFQLILALFSNKFSAKSKINENKLNESHAINLNELRELKKLVDEGVITQEEFENRKKKIL